MTELEKLKTVADLIRDISHGKLELRASDIGYACIRASDDAYIAMDMVMRNNTSRGYVDVTFQAHVRRMGSSMNVKDLSHLQEEIQQAHALVLALEIPQFRPTYEDLMVFHDYLVQEQRMREEQAPQIQGMEMQSM